MPLPAQNDGEARLLEKENKTLEARVAALEAKHYSCVCTIL